MGRQDKHIPSLSHQAGVVLFSRWNEFSRLREAVLNNRDTEDIHDLRVASRRLRAALGLLGPYLPVKSAKLLKEIRLITRVLGGVRNLDEALLYFRALSGVPPLLISTLERARKAEIKRVVKTLEAFSCRSHEEMFRKSVARLTGEAGRERASGDLQVYFSKTSLRRYQQVHDLLGPAIGLEQVLGRHQLRIAIKKWRYLLETLGQVCSQDYGTTLEVLKEYQTVLGKLNDLGAFYDLCVNAQLSPGELQPLGIALAKETDEQMKIFVQLAENHPIHYIFLL